MRPTSRIWVMTRRADSKALRQEHDDEAQHAQVHFLWRRWRGRHQRATSLRGSLPS